MCGALFSCFSAKGYEVPPQFGATKYWKGGTFHLIWLKQESSVCGLGVAHSMTPSSNAAGWNPFDPPPLRDGEVWVLHHSVKQRRCAISDLHLHVPVRAAATSTQLPNEAWL